MTQSITLAAVVFFGVLFLRALKRAGDAEGRALVLKGARLVVVAALSVVTVATLALNPVPPTPTEMAVLTLTALNYDLLAGLAEGHGKRREGHGE